MSAPIDNTFVREVETNNGKKLKIHQLEIGDVGCVVWDAALVLSKYIETDDFYRGETWKGKNVIELGAGTGVLGIMAAVYGASVTITDLPDFLPLINLNIATNKQLLTGDAVARSLKWGEERVEGSSYDYVLLADCIYYEKDVKHHSDLKDIVDISLDPLVEAIASVCSADTTVLCCYEQRTTGNKPELERRFLELIHEKFEVEDIPLERQDSLFRSEDIFIKKFTQKKLGSIT